MVSKDWLKNYFKDKIDWKFYNYLMMKVTKYQDNGSDMILYVCLDLSEFNGDDSLFIYQSEVGYQNPQLDDEGTRNYFENITDWHLEFSHRKNGFVYVIDAYTDAHDMVNTENNLDRNAANNLWEEIKDKCIDLRGQFDKSHSTLRFKKRNSI